MSEVDIVVADGNNEDVIIVIAARMTNVPVDTQLHDADQIERALWRGLCFGTYKKLCHEMGRRLGH